MNYRQWKKRYKKLYGTNPPLELDKRKQCKLAKKAIKQISYTDFYGIGARVAENFKNAIANLMRGLGGAFDTAGTICRNAAGNMQQIEIEGRVINWNVRKYGRGRYAVYEENALGGKEEINAITYSQKAAEKIAEILESDYVEHIRWTDPERIQRRNDVTDGIWAAVVKAYESGAFGE